MKRPIVIIAVVCFALSQLSTPAKAAAPTEATITLTHAQVLALNTTPITLVASPGAGKMILLHKFIAVGELVTPYTGSGSVGLQTNGVNQGVITGTALISGSVTHAAQAPSMPYTAVDISNSALVIVATGAGFTGGNAANKFSVKVWYTIENAVSPL